MTEPNSHTWEYCDCCDCRTVICGKCKNNCCNGGYGEVNGIQCDACPSAYAAWDAGDDA